MTRTIRKNANLSTIGQRRLPNRTAKALVWTTMVVLCAAAHFEFMRLISPVATAIGF